MNTKRIPVSITVLDQFPVSVTKEIEVKDEFAPEGQINKESGIVTWVLSLQPAQERKLKMSYAVKYPKERKVVLE